MGQEGREGGMGGKEGKVSRVYYSVMHTQLIHSSRTVS